MADVLAARLELVGALFGQRAPQTVAAWRAALDEAARLHVLEGLHARVRGAHLAAPDEIHEVLEGAATEAAVRTELALRVGALVCDAADAATVVKGAALVAWGAMAPDARYFADVDVLVPGAQAERATRALQLAGFELRGAYRHDGRRRSPARWPGATWTSPEGAVLDLHVVARPLAPTTSVTVAQGRVRIPSPEGLVGGLCRHVEAHHLGTRRGALRHALDLRAVRAFVSAQQWRALLREPVIGRAVAALDALERASEAHDALGVERLIGEPPLRPLRRHAERALQQLVRVATHEPSQLPWLLVPHPRYVRETTGARGLAALARAYVRRYGVGRGA